MNQLSLEHGGAMQALEKEGAGPLALALPAAFAALGLYGAQADIREGISRGSVGQTLWGAAQVPLAFVGVGAGKMLATGGIKALSKVPGSKLFGKAVTGLEHGFEFVGGKALGATARAGEMAGLRRAPAWLRARGAMGKQMAGLMVGQQVMPSGFGGEGEDAGEGAMGMYGQGAGQGIGLQTQSPEIKNVAPGIELPPPMQAPVGHEATPANMYKNPQEQQYQ